MMSWEDLTAQEKTALRQLVKGQVHDVPWRLKLASPTGSPRG